MLNQTFRSQQWIGWTHHSVIFLALLIGSWVGECSAIASEPDPIAGFTSLNELDPTTGLSELEAEPTDAAMTQVTSVSQLTDVQPTDWAFQALQSLVERYGVIAGYPDGTFRGDRALTRYEFAAGLNAALLRVEELVNAGTTDLVTQADWETLQKLQTEFAAELATLRGRVDVLEARTAEVEAQQFSTTTKLSGLAFMNATGAFAGDSVQLEAADLNTRLELRSAGRDANGQPIVQTVEDDPAITLSNLVWLSLTTSFTGKDSLLMVLAAGNGESPANVFASAGLFDTFGSPLTDQAGGLQENDNDVVIRDFFYSFPVSDAIQVSVGPRINWYRFFDFNRFTFFLTGAGSFNASGSPFLNAIDRGSGAVVRWQLNEQLQLSLAYLGENDEFLPASLFNSASNPRQGLFNGTNSLTAELAYSPSDALNFRFLYNRTRIQQIFGTIGGAVGEPILGVADDGFGGPLDNATADTFGVNFDWLITPGLGIFGRYAYGSTNLYPTTPGVPDGEVNAQTIQAGVAFPDLGKTGALGVVSFLIPFDVLEGRNFLISGGGDGGTQYEIEASYYFPITDQVAIVPSFYAIVNPNNFDSNPTIYVGNLRTQFSF